VAIKDSIIYVADQGYGLIAYTLGDTLHPTLRFSKQLAEGSSDIVLKDSCLYLACGNNGMIVFDLNDPLNPDSLMAIHTSGFVSDIALGDTFVYLSCENGGLVALSDREPSSPTRLGFFNSPGTARGSAAYVYFVLLADSDTMFVMMPNYSNGIEDEKLALPGAISISNCYPNPFNPSTRIAFELKESAEIALDAYDICGRKVANLAKGNYQPGRYSLIWDAKGLVSGVYYLRLSDGKISTTTSVTYLK
jgi:hypothetical protein